MHTNNDNKRSYDICIMLYFKKLYHYVVVVHEHEFGRSTKNHVLTIVLLYHMKCRAVNGLHVIILENNVINNAYFAFYVKLLLSLSCQISKILGAYHKRNCTYIFSFVTKNVSCRHVYLLI